MSDIVRSHNVFSSTGEQGTLSVRLDIKTLAIDYEALTRDYEVSLVINSTSDTSQSIFGNSVNFTLFGVYVPFSIPIAVPSGESVLYTTVISGVKDADYAEKSFFTLRLNFICTPLGLDSPAYVPINIPLWKLYVTPELAVSGADFALGSGIELIGEFLEVGYEAYGEILINGSGMGVYPLSGDNRILPTFCDWIAAYPYKKSLSAFIRVWAYFDGTPLPEELLLTVNLMLDESDGAPSMQVSVSFPSENEAVSRLGVPVRGRSKADIRVLNAVGGYGAEIEGCAVVLDGTAYEGYCLEEMTLAGTHRYTVTVYDSRGFSASSSGEFEVLDYAPPTLSADAIRTDELGNADKKGEYISLLASVSGTYPFDGSNEYSFYYTVNVQGAQGERTETAFAPDARILINAGLDIGSAYEVGIICRDTFGGTALRTFLLESERVELNIAKNRVGIGKYASEENLLDVAWSIRCVGDVKVIDESGNEKSLLGGSSSEITFHNVSSFADFVELVTPGEGSIALRLMKITGSETGYSEGLHAFLVFNFNGSGGHIELAQL